MRFSRKTITRQRERETDRQTERERHETAFNGPNSPGGHRTKNLKILMRGFSGKWARMDGRTDERTEANPKVHRLRRETKNPVGIFL